MRLADLALAELYFLDTEPSEADVVRGLALVTAAGWSREEAAAVLVRFIAPVAGANLGYLVYPVIGAWAGFDKDSLCGQINRLARNRARWPPWFYALSDWYCAWMLKKLGVDRLLSRIPSSTDSKAAGRSSG